MSSPAGDRGAYRHHFVLALAVGPTRTVVWSILSGGGCPTTCLNGSRKAASFSSLSTAKCAEGTNSAGLEWVRRFFLLPPIITTISNGIVGLCCSCLTIYTVSLRSLVKRV